MLNELAKEIHQVAVEHGWWDEEKPLYEIIALIHSELSEALEEYRDGKPNVYYRDKKPEGIAIELADCAIRILDYCGKYGVNIDAAVLVLWTPPGVDTIPELITECHCVLSRAYMESAPRHYLAKCINLIDFWCKENGVDLIEIIKIKHEYNKTRPYRHGGKRC